MDCIIEWVAPSLLIPYEKNAKVHTNQQIEQIANSIREFGFRQPLVIDAHNVVVIGHARLLAAKSLNLSQLPCIRADDLTPEQINALRLADNKLNESEWSIETLQLELFELKDVMPMESFGFDIEAKEPDLEIIEDEVPEVQDKSPRCKMGDIWQLGKHRLMCGDSTDAEAVKTLMDGRKADLVFTDPPYNVGIGSRNKAINEADAKNNMPRRGGRIETDIIGDKGMTDEEIGETLWKPAFCNMRDNAKDDCSIYVTMPQGGSHMMMMMMSAAWQVKHELIWVKNQPTFSMGRLDYDYQHEPICYGWNKSHKFYGNGEQTKSIWHFDKPRESKLHPTMKPVGLIANAIENSSAEGDIVMDLFGGSGTTLIACSQTNRVCCMMELDPHYCDVILERWENLTGSRATCLTDTEEVEK